MTDEYTHTGLTLSIKHEPDFSLEDDGAGGKQLVELPGFLVIGTEVDGAFVPIFRRKAGGVLADVARAKAAAELEAANTPPPPPPAA